jgi:putative transposase
MRSSTATTKNAPHQALDRKVPAAVYTRLPADVSGPRGAHLPYHDATITVTHSGRLCFLGRKVKLSQVFAGQHVGVAQVGERVWLVTFIHYDLGYFDDETGHLEPIDNRSLRRCYLCPRPRAPV